MRILNAAACLLENPESILHQLEAKMFNLCSSPSGRMASAESKSPDESLAVVEPKIYGSVITPINTCLDAVSYKLAEVRRRLDYFFQEAGVHGSSEYKASWQALSRIWALAANPAYWQRRQQNTAATALQPKSPP